MTVDNEPILSGRACNDCTLCCKVLSITELNKPQSKWCDHCNIGKGCKIYDERPAECRHFYCGYLTWPMVDEHWFPARSKLVIVSELEGHRIAVHVDPGRPNAWREQPFYSELKQWSAFAAEDRHQVVVCIGSRAIVIFPDRDVDLGPVASDERIITLETKRPMGNRLEAMKLKADDPRIAGMSPGRLYRPEKGTF